MSGIEEIFGTMVFSDAVMRERLPSETYAAVQLFSRGGTSDHPHPARVFHPALNNFAADN